MRLDLPWLIAPVAKEQFIDAHWSKSPLRVIRNAPSYYSSLLPESDLEFILQSAARTPRALEILQEGDRPLRPQSYAHAIEAFRRGKSLRVDSIQRFSRPITLLCRSLEQATGSSVNVNLYLTPGAGKKALSRHYDTHDVFVLQIFGNKFWRLFDPPSFAPLEHLPLQRRESVRDMKQFRLKDDQSGKQTCTLTQDFTLTAGEMLYLPRGFWHEAESEPDAVSCHLTVGIQPTTYLDLLTVAVAGAARSLPSLRQSLPFGFTVEENAQASVEQTMSEIMEELPGKLDVPTSLGELAGIFLRQYKAGLDNHILGPLDAAPANGVEGTTRLRLGHGVVFGLNTSVAPTQLLCGSKAFAIAPQYEAAVRYAAKSEVFTPAELPGELTLEEKVALSKQLVSEGILVPVSPIAALEHKGARLVPTHIDLKTNTVEWIDLGKHPLSEPFFHQTVKRYRENFPEAKTRSSRLRALANVKEQIKPSGFIFHVSRCGSTLLSNSLKHFEDTVVVSEPQPVSSVLEILSRSLAAEERQKAERLLQGVIQSYGHLTSGENAHLVFKFSSWNLLQMQQILKQWPDVPVVILVRDPLEVAVSSLDDPPGWMRWNKRRRIELAKSLGWKVDEADLMSDVKFCVRLIAEFLERAQEAAKAGCTILDYRELDVARVAEIARLFGIAVTPEASEAVKDSFSVYSKDPRGTKQHEDDGERKRTKASDELRQQIERWAKPHYDALMAAKTV